MILFWTTILAVFSVFLVTSALAGRSFTIDYENNQFLKDGKPFRYISGSFHYNRVLKPAWSDRLSKMKSAGLDAVEFYVPWNFHESSPGRFERIDYLTDFIQAVHETGLLAILRAGPYICGEWDNGGFPLWFAGTPGLEVRRTNELYSKEIERWFGKFLPTIKPYLYANGGPIIMVQVENEYGYNSACDHSYMKFLVDQVKGHLGEDVILFTVDGNSEHLLKCGAVEGVFATVDFGVSSNASVRGSFELQRKYNRNKGPLVNTEFYPGWFDAWGQRHHRRNTEDIVQTMTLMNAMNASFNFYMFHGGTNFGYWSGVVHEFDRVVTSYDYDAPISESGDITPKYLAIRQAIHQMTGKPVLPVPPNPEKKAYGIVKLKNLGSLLNFLSVASPEPKESDFPLLFESLRLRTGFVVYETHYGAFAKNLSVAWLRDQAYVFQDGQMVGTLGRGVQQQIRLNKTKKLVRLQLLVEQQGRKQDPLESKGIGNVTIDGTLLKGWKIYPLDLSKLSRPPSVPVNVRTSTKSGASANYRAMLDIVHTRESEMLSSERTEAPSRRLIRRYEFFNKNNIQQRQERVRYSGEVEDRMAERQNPHPLLATEQFAPSIFYGTFPAPDLADTFFDPTGWGKGQLFINGFNLGRYWPSKGPQVTLYVPKEVLRHVNTVVILELEKPGLCEDKYHCSVRFVRASILDGPRE